MGQKDVLLGYIEEFDSYGIKKDDITQLAKTICRHF